MGEYVRDYLIQKEPRLVQRCTFKSGIESLEEIYNLSQLVRPDYMGAAEFEWGEPNRSAIRMVTNYPFYKMFVFNEYKDKSGRPLKVYGPAIFFKNIKKIVDKLVVDSDCLKRPIHLNQHFDNYVPRPLDYMGEDNFWWDIENDFFMFFEHVDRVQKYAEDSRKKLGTIAKVIGSTVQSKTKLKKFYIGEITTPYWHPLGNTMNMLKSYQYDSSTKTHYVEYVDQATLSDIFMEAIVLAKNVKGDVVFDVKGETFIINGSMFPDIVVEENGVSMIDSRTYTDRIEELRQQYEQIVTNRGTSFTIKKVNN